MKTFLFLSVVTCLFATPALAHPGRTASDGCHYCRTNCDSWGEAWNERHCHGGGTTADTNTSTSTKSSIPTITKPIVYFSPTAVPRRTPTSTPRPTKTPTPTPTLTPTPTSEPTKEPESSVVINQKTVDSLDSDKKQSNTEPVSTGDTVSGIGILGGMGYGVFWVAKKVLSRFRS